MLMSGDCLCSDERTPHVSASKPYLAQHHRHDQDDGERQRPALVLRGQHQEREQDAQRENPDRRIAGQDLLVGELGPLETHAIRQFALGKCRHQRLGLA
jgi:hypothetical protein